MHEPDDRSVEPDPDERDEHAYEDAWYPGAEGAFGAPPERPASARRGRPARRRLGPALELLEESAGRRTALPLVLGSSLGGPVGQLGRLGLLIHSTAGYVDPGWDGYLTLELSNVANLPITLYPAMKIGQISFFRLTTPADTPYGRGRNKYQGQRGPTASRFFEDFR